MKTAIFGCALNNSPAFMARDGRREDTAVRFAACCGDSRTAALSVATKLIKSSGCGETILSSLIVSRVKGEASKCHPATLQPPSPGPSTNQAPHHDCGSVACFA